MTKKRNAFSLTRFLDRERRFTVQTCYGIRVYFIRRFFSQDRTFVDQYKTNLLLIIELLPRWKTVLVFFKRPMSSNWKFGESKDMQFLRH